jgi:hypothetical protein
MWHSEGGGDFVLGWNFVVMKPQLFFSQLNRHLQQRLQKISISLSSRTDSWQTGTQLYSTHDTNPNVETKAHSVDNFMDVMRVILCQELTIVDAEHTPSNKVRFECPQNILQKRSSAEC